MVSDGYDRFRCDGGERRVSRPRGNRIEPRHRQIARYTPGVYFCAEISVLLQPICASCCIEKVRSRHPDDDTCKLSCRAWHHVSRVYERLDNIQRDCTPLRSTIFPRLAKTASATARPAPRRTIYPLLSPYVPPNLSVSTDNVLHPEPHAGAARDDP